VATRLSLEPCLAWYSSGRFTRGKFITEEWFYSCHKTRGGTRRNKV